MTPQVRISDTTAEAAEVYVAAYASLSGPARVERSMEMAEEVKQVTLAGIAHRNPEFSSAEVHREMAPHPAWRGSCRSDFVSQSDLLRAAVELLDGAGIPYMIVGRTRAPFMVNLA